MTETATSPYKALAQLLTYPNAGYGDLAQRAPEALSQLGSFASGVQGLSLTELQELFTRTFDLSPACSLEVGWHLYGEEYARGAFMVSMREQLRRLAVQENGELPDHLTHVLLLVDAMGADERGLFIGSFVLPAVRKMVKALEGKDNPYGGVIKAVEEVLEQTPGVDQQQPPEEHPYKFRIFGNPETPPGSEVFEEEAPHG